MPRSAHDLARVLPDLPGCVLVPDLEPGAAVPVPGEGDCTEGGPCPEPGGVQVHQASVLSLQP